MSLPESVLDFLEKSPVSLVANGGGPKAVAEIKSFYDAEIGPFVKNSTYGELCYAGLLMAQDYIWEAHEIVQDYQENEASWWHAYMHRMEGDYGNSAYWYRRVRSSQGYLLLEEAVREMSLPDELSKLQAGSWDSFLFNELVSRNQGSSCDNDLRLVHELECKTLLELCYNKAI